MNETQTDTTTKPFWQISEYLSKRGFAVLKYDKRGIGENGAVINPHMWTNVTVNDFIRDARKALDVLIAQPEVDPKRII
jgi:alpha-beta hydrolase superfamily lysophospholipase